MSEQQYGPHQKYSVMVRGAVVSSNQSSNDKGKRQQGQVINQPVSDPLDKLTGAELVDQYITSLSDAKKLLRIMVELTPVNSKRLLLHKIQSDFNQS